MCVILVVICTLCQIVLSEALDTACVTPNGQHARCVTLDNCKVIKNAIMTGNRTAIDFYQKSKCGITDVPLVCCGSSAFLTNSEQAASSLYHFFDRQICGFQKPDDRVLGGTITEIGEFPWIALLGYQSVNSNEISFKCGGTLLNNKYILTAAHCLKVNRFSGLKLVLVRLGEWKISTEEDCNEGLANPECADPVMDIKIAKQIPHLRYSRRSGNNDIALLRLERTVQYSDYVQPICLPFQDASPAKVGTLLIVAGWGSIENGSQSDIKLKVQVPVADLDYCKEHLQLVGNVTDNHICAGGEKGKDACKGDSGGPLMQGVIKNVDDQAQWFQEGIIAWGIGCGRKDFPAVYTRVPKYVNWIVDNIN